MLIVIYTIGLAYISLITAAAMATALLQLLGAAAAILTLLAGGVAFIWAMRVAGGDLRQWMHP